VTLIAAALPGCGKKAHDHDHSHDHGLLDNLFDDREHTACALRSRSLEPDAVRGRLTPEAAARLQKLEGALPDPVAIVDSVGISRQAFVAELLRVSPDGLSADENGLRDAVRRALDGLIDGVLTRRAVHKVGLPAVATETDKDYRCQRDNHPDKAAFIKALGREGKTPGSLRRQLRVRYGLDALLDRRGGVEVSAADVKAAWQARPDMMTDMNGDALPFEQARPFVRDKLLEQRRAEARSRLLAELRREADIDTRITPLGAPRAGSR